VRLRRISIVLGVLAAATAVAIQPHGQPSALAATARPAERLDRGLISVRSGSGNLVSWRLLGTEAADTGFNVGAPPRPTIYAVG
jgi:Rhamnogalacturonan I lyases beta-sheet domain